jgi:hypothetical protein
LQVSCPAQTAVSRHLPPSRHHVSGKFGGQYSEIDKEIKNKMIENQQINTYKNLAIV